MNIMTYTGILMDPLAPNPEQIRMEDIAHALSMISRANGHFPEIHTVAQHCLECAAEAKARNLPQDIQLFCLLHDGAEAYLGDFISPVKERMPAYGKAERKLLAMIYEKFAGRVPSAEEKRIRSSQIDIFDTQPLITLTHRLGISTGNDGNMQPAFHSQLISLVLFHVDYEKNRRYFLCLLQRKS